ncbi:hypothetical protein [Planctomycetes bacterium K23_9]|uniref:Uncharacterized protein n=1 Tax=Stieleria marina TaxID=1930275 RepID=A0A517P1J3_9BACT|nr:hypothetical protein K239x_52580 [Planctomycetes bacterium K23_9]
MISPVRIARNSSAAKPARVFTGALVVSGMVWVALSLILILAVTVFAVEFVRQTVLVTVLSGIVAAVSLMPGLVSEWTPQLASNRTVSASTKKQNYLGPVFGGIILRMVATVALFVMCRYQFAESVNWIAALTIGWYVVLTCVEVTWLARKLPQLDATSTVAPLIVSGLVPNTLDVA